MKRYPLQNLIDAAGLSTDLTDREIARRLHMDRTVLRRARANGFVERSADRYACRLGFVPWLVWPEWIEDVIDDVSVECAEQSCAVRFVPSKKGHRFCSTSCQWRAANPKKRARYASNPELRESRRAKRRAYYQESGKVERLKKRLSYEVNREEILAKQAAYREANREARRLRDAAYRAANRERLNAARRERYRRNVEMERARQREYDRAKAAAKREAA